MHGSCITIIYTYRTRKSSTFCNIFYLFFARFVL
nr:MAG TPA: hypothetical protein [Caudoviricetes sp.]